MKIAFVYQPLGPISIPLKSGSLGIWIYHVAKRLTSSADIFVYARKGAGQENVIRHDQVEYRRFSVFPDPIIIRFLGLFSRLRNKRKPFLASSLYFLFYIVKVARDLKKQRVDIVHIFNFSQFVLIIRYFAPKCKIILHMECEWLSQLDREMIEKRIEASDLVIGCSNYITEKIITRFPDFQHKCITVYNGVEIKDEAADSGKRMDSKQKLLFVGRVSPEKGIHDLLPAFEKVAQEFPDCSLDIVGPEWIAPLEYIVGLSDDDKVASLASFYNESYLAQLQRMIPGYLAQKVNFVGHVPPENLGRYYQNADILINPSYSESFGMTLVEAMSHRLPVVATKVGGMVEIVDDEKVGLLVDAGHVEALARAITALLRDAKLRMKMGQAGRQRAGRGAGAPGGAGGAR